MGKRGRIYEEEERKKRGREVGKMEERREENLDDSGERGKRRKGEEREKTN